MAEGRGRADRAKAADPIALSAHVRAKSAVHWNAVHLLIRPLAGVVARHVGHQPRREQPHVPEAAFAEQHLVERRHAARRGEATTTWQASGTELCRVVARL